MRVSRSRVRIDILSKSKTVVSPQSVGGAYPQPFLEWIVCKGGSFPARVALFPAAVLFSQQGGNRSGDEFLSRESRIPQKSPLRGIFLFLCIHHEKNSMAYCIEK